MSYSDKVAGLYLEIVENVMKRFGGDNQESIETENYKLVVNKFEENQGFEALEMLQKT